MTDCENSFDERSWAFALQIYAEPGVAQACLRLQEEAGVDVMLLLAVAFAATCGIVLSANDIQEMNDVCRPWREQMVRPLRALRVALKSGPLPAPSPATERLRARIKASELDAERCQSDLLASWLQARARTPRRATRDELTSALRYVVGGALPEADRRPIGDFKSAIDTIAAAALMQSTVSPGG